MDPKLAPFSCTHSPDLPKLLYELNISLAISTYQAGKVILISAINHEQLVQLPRNFEKPMGIAIQANQIAIATRSEAVILSNAPRMAANYPKQPKTYDALYLPRCVYFTGEVDIHDIFWASNKLWAVNTRFSCLCTIDEQYSFRPQWKPDFISDITPEDRCHLNGIAMHNGKPKYATALGKTDIAGGWRENKVQGGIIIDIENNKIIADGLAMPHSPRLYNNELYVLLSATGELAKVNISNGSVEVIKEMNGFVRGMDKHGDFLFIGLSKLRESSNTFADLPISKKSIFAGIVVIHLPTKSLAGYIKYENSVEEIYDVKVLPGMKRPGLLNHIKEDHKIALTTPEAEYWAVKQEEK